MTKQSVKTPGPLFSSARLCQQSYCHGAGVSRPPVVHPLTRISQKPLHGSRPNYAESYQISPDSFFFFFKIFDFQIFTIFFFFFVNMGLYGNQIFKTLLLPQFQSDVNQTL